MSGAIRYQSTRGAAGTERMSLMDQGIARMADEASKLFSRGGMWNPVKAAAAVTAKPWDLLLCNPTTAAFTVTLPDPTDRAVAYSRVLVKNDSASTNTITIVSAAGGTIDGATSQTITTARGLKELWASGSEWKVVG